MRFIGKVLAAGAAGTEALNVATYLDMAVRGRPSSSVPQADVEKLFDGAGLKLGEGATADNRKTAIGALMGYATGATGALAYGLARQVLPPLPPTVAATLVGLSAMAATDASSTALATTDPRSWSLQDWLADIVPHLAYGAGVVVTYEALRST